MNRIYLLYLDVDGVLKGMDKAGLSIPYKRAGNESDLIHPDSISTLHKLSAMFKHDEDKLYIVWSASAGYLWTSTLLESGFKYESIGIGEVTQTIDRNLNNRSQEILNTNKLIESLGYDILRYVAVDDEPSLIKEIPIKNKVLVKHPPNNCLEKVKGVWQAKQDVLNSDKYFIQTRHVKEIFNKLKSAT